VHIVKRKDGGGDVHVLDRGKYGETSRGIHERQVGFGKYLHLFRCQGHLKEHEVDQTVTTPRIVYPTSLNEFHEPCACEQRIVGHVKIKFKIYRVVDDPPNIGLTVDIGHRHIQPPEGLRGSETGDGQIFFLVEVEPGRVHVSLVVSRKAVHMMK